MRYLLEKITLTIPTCFLTFSLGNKEILFGVIFIVVLDTILGVWVSLRYRRFNSYKLGRLVSKIGQYMLALASAWILTAVEPSFSFLFRGVGLFIIFTEVISNFEKLALLGMKLPIKLISKINKEYEKLLDDQSTVKVEEIMDSRDSKK